MLSGLFRGSQSVAVGGPIGSLKDAKTMSSNPNYDAAYLASRLGATPSDPNQPLDYQMRDRYNNAIVDGMDDVQKTVYLQNAVKGYEAEAEECLKKEFKSWLSGEHIDNAHPQPYLNGPGRLQRRDARGLPLDEWRPTWWGTQKLTHLDGVKEYLRKDSIDADKENFKMNMLAQFGPQNLDEAWAYFKYWVKGRPVGAEKCIALGGPDGNERVFESQFRPPTTQMQPIDERASYFRDPQQPTVEERRSYDDQLLREWYKKGDIVKLAKRIAQAPSSSDSSLLREMRSDDQSDGDYRAFEIDFTQDDGEAEARAFERRQYEISRKKHEELDKQNPLLIIKGRNGNKLEDAEKARNKRLNRLANIRRFERNPKYQRARVRVALKRYSEEMKAAEEEEAEEMKAAEEEEADEAESAEEERVDERVEAEAEAEGAEEQAESAAKERVALTRYRAKAAEEEAKLALRRAREERQKALRELRVASRAGAPAGGTRALKAVKEAEEDKEWADVYKRVRAGGLGARSSAASSSSNFDLGAGAIAPDDDDTIMNLPIRMTPLIEEEEEAPSRSMTPFRSMTQVMEEEVAQTSPPEMESEPRWLTKAGERLARGMLKPIARALPRFSSPLKVFSPIRAGIPRGRVGDQVGTIEREAAKVLSQLSDIQVDIERERRSRAEQETLEDSSETRVREQENIEQEARLEKIKDRMLYNLSRSKPQWTQEWDKISEGINYYEQATKTSENLTNLKRYKEMMQSLKNTISASVPKPEDSDPDPDPDGADQEEYEDADQDEWRDVSDKENSEADEADEATSVDDMRKEILARIDVIKKRKTQAVNDNDMNAREMYVDQLRDLERQLFVLNQAAKKRVDNPFLAAAASGVSRQQQPKPKELPQVTDEEVHQSQIERLRQRRKASREAKKTAEYGRVPDLLDPNEDLTLEDDQMVIVDPKLHAAQKRAGDPYPYASRRITLKEYNDAIKDPYYQKWLQSVTERPRRLTEKQFSEQPLPNREALLYDRFRATGPTTAAAVVKRLNDLLNPGIDTVDRRDYNTKEDDLKSYIKMMENIDVLRVEDQKLSDILPGREDDFILHPNLVGQVIDNYIADNFGNVSQRKRDKLFTSIARHILYMRGQNGKRLDRTEFVW
jgi:hypothetical protein